MLPPKAYETLRWVLIVIIPAISVLLNSLTTIWNLQIPIQEINLTIDAIALFLGTIFGISKIQHDNNSN